MRTCKGPLILCLQNEISRFGRLVEYKRLAWTLSSMFVDINKYLIRKWFTMYIPYSNKQWK